MMFSFILLAILVKFNVAVEEKFFMVDFLDYVPEYTSVYANVDITKEGDYRGFLCG
jgi:hypothetical protein